MRIASVLLCLLLLPLSAQTNIVIDKTGSGLKTIDFTRFRAGAGEARVFFDTLRANLRLNADLKEAAPSAAQFMITGQSAVSGGQLNITVQLVPTGDTRARWGKRFQVEAASAESLGRHVSDQLVKELTGRPGFATKRIALLGRSADGRAKEVFMVFPDGGGLRQMTKDRSVKLAPQWAPDAQSLSYTSYHRGFADLYRHHLSPPKREAVSKFSGINAGGAISPDGSKMALILSKEGRPELYVMNLATKRLQRLTRTPMSPKSSPSWSPDGQRIVFSSGHEGRPHLYIVSRNGGAPKRVSRGGAENLSPDWGENGLIVFTRRDGRRYQTAILDPNSGETKVISPADADYEDPSWAPDGYHVVASRSVGNQSRIYLLDSSNRRPIQLELPAGFFYMPDWSP